MSAMDPMANLIVLSGRLTRDPETTFLTDGKTVCKGGIAVKGFKKEEVHFFNFQVWGKSAEYVRKYLKKGDVVYLQGNLRQERWTDKTGAARERVVVNVEKISGLEWKEGPDGPPASAAAPAPDADLPF
jgi:single-strand DNA-binding protein